MSQNNAATITSIKTMSALELLSMLVEGPGVLVDSACSDVLDAIIDRADELRKEQVQ